MYVLYVDYGSCDYYIEEVDGGYRNQIGCYRAEKAFLTRKGIEEYIEEEKKNTVKYTVFADIPRDDWWIEETNRFYRGSSNRYRLNSYDTREEALAIVNA